MDLVQHIAAEECTFIHDQTLLMLILQAVTTMLRSCYTAFAEHACLAYKGVNVLKHK